MTLKKKARWASRLGTDECVVRRCCVTRRKDPFRVQPDTEVWKWISRLVASGSACCGVWVTGTERFPTGRPPTRRARTKTLSRERDSFDRCRSFTGNRISHAPFFVTKRKAMIVCVCVRMYVRISLVGCFERLAKSDWSCVGLPSFSATR